MKTISTPEKNEAQLYWDKVTAFLQAQQLGAWVQIDLVCKPENRERFLDCVKLFIRATGYRFELSNDYTAVRRFRAD